MASGFAPFQATPRLNLAQPPQIGAFSHLNGKSQPQYSNSQQQMSYDPLARSQQTPSQAGASSRRTPNEGEMNSVSERPRVDRERGQNTMAVFAQHVAELEAESDAHLAEAERLRDLLEKYKSEAIKAQKQKLMMCFDHASSNLLGYAFSEWKEHTREEGKMRIRYEMEMKLKAETERANKLLREHEIELETQLRELHAQFDEERKGHMDDIRVRDLEIANLNDKLAMRDQEFSDLKTALAKANRFFLTFSEQAASLRELSESARAALEEDDEVKNEARYITVRSVVPPGSASAGGPSADYMKDTLHDLLAKVDGRYMPRMFKNPMEEREQQMQSRAAQQYFETVPQPHQTIMQGNVLDRSRGGGVVTPGGGFTVKGAGPFGTSSLYGGSK